MNIWPDAASSDRDPTARLGRMPPVVATLVGAVLLVLGIGLFPFAALAMLAWLGGSTGPLWVIAAFDVLLLIMGATAVVGLWSRRDPT